MSVELSGDDYFSDLGRRLRDDALRREDELSDPRRLLLQVWADLESEREFLRIQRQEVKVELVQLRQAHREELLRHVWQQTFRESEKERADGRTWRRRTVAAWGLVLLGLLWSSSKVRSGQAIWPLEQVLVVHVGLCLVLLALPTLCWQNATRHFGRHEKLQDEWLALQRNIDVVQAVSADQVNLISSLGPPAKETGSPDGDRGRADGLTIGGMANELLLTIRTLISKRE